MIEYHLIYGRKDSYDFWRKLKAAQKGKKFNSGTIGGEIPGHPPDGFQVGVGSGYAGSGKAGGDCRVFWNFPG